MRGSASTQLIGEEGQPAVGILLEHNYCSEHEWGVDSMRTHMGGMSRTQADEKRICNFSRIRVKTPADQIIWHEEKGLAILGVDNGLRWLQGRVWSPEDMKRHKIKEGDPLPLIWAKVGYEFGLPEKITKKNEKNSWVVNRQTSSAWDGESFGIVSREPKVIEFLRSLKDALLKGDAVLHISGTNNPFKPVSGLVLAIESLVPQEQKDVFEEKFKDMYKLGDAAKNTGIEAKLKEAGKQWFALSPCWATMQNRITGRDANNMAIVQDVNTEYPVMFWLNPMDQKTNNSMRCTVEDLEAWIKNEGPIPTKQKVRA